MVYLHSEDYEHSTDELLGQSFVERARSLGARADLIAVQRPGRTVPWDRAKTLAEDAIKMQPNEPALIDTLGWVYFRMGDFGQARGLIEQALAAAPNSDVLNHHMGAVLVKLGQKDEAREKLRKALEGAEDYPGRGDAEKLLKELG